VSIAHYALWRAPLVRGYVSSFFKMPTAIKKIRLLNEKNGILFWPRGVIEAALVLGTSGVIREGASPFEATNFAG
jgi:hypothetical protein